MIRRTKHNFSASNNKLKQSSFVASKGINVLANPMEAQNVVDIVNFDVEDDGGIRIRKPVIAKYDYLSALVSIMGVKDEEAKCYSIIKVIYLYDKLTRLVIYKYEKNDVKEYGFYFLNENNSYKDYVYKYTDYNGGEYYFNAAKSSDSVESGVLSFIKDWAPTHSDLFNLENVTTVNLNTSTILGNCTVDITQSLFNVDEGGLYDSTVLSEEDGKKAARYLQVMWLSTDEVWCVKVINPEMNVVTSEQLSDGTITPTIKYNTTLDNNYAIRDEYNKSSVAVKSIIPYIYSEVVNNKIIPKKATVTTTDYNIFISNLLGALIPYSDVNYGEYVTNYMSGTYTTYDGLQEFSIKLYIRTFNDDTTHGIEGTLELYYLQSYAHITIVPNIDVNINVLNVNGTVHSSISVKLGSEDSLNLRSPINDEFGKIIGYSYSIHRHLGPNLEIFNKNGEKYDPHKDVEKYLKYNVLTTGNFTYIITDCLRNSIKYLTEKKSYIEKDTNAFVPVISFSKNVIDNNNITVCFKAFMKFVDFHDLKYYIVWERTFDGATWQQVFGDAVKQGYRIKIPKNTSSTTSEIEYDILIAQQVCAVSENDYIGTVNVRPDVLFQHQTGISPCTYRVSVYTKKESVGDGSYSNPYEVDLTLAQYSYELKFSEDYEYAYSTEQVHTSNGNKLYWKKRIYSYGNSEFNNVIYPTDVDSFITPIQNAIDLDASSNATVTALIPWRDYLVAATSNALYLITPVDGGYTTKIINTAIGIPKEDSQTCKSILNGVIFKSGSKVYSLFPNMYSGTDSVLNLSELSKPIDGLIPDTYGNYNCFAFTTERYYYLFIPVSKDETLCFKYNFNSRTWVKHSYPICIKNYTLLGFDDIRIFDESKEYLFECDDFRKYADISKPYGDILTEDIVCPINFRLDSGQKTDNISTDKQFVETKLIASLTNNENIIPLDIDIYIDGNKFPFKIDLTTDGTFVKDAIKDIITLNATVDSNSVELQNVLKQLFLRYSGRGKSIRHIISGKSMCDFKLYEIYYRYKTLNVKQ